MSRYSKFCIKFIATINTPSTLTLLNSIVSIEETVQFLTIPLRPKNSPSSGQKRGSLPVNSRVIARQTKQVLLAFFDSKGLIHMHVVPRGVTIYINKVLGNLMSS
jgi:hypothetical protein